MDDPVVQAVSNPGSTVHDALADVGIDPRPDRRRSQVAGVISLVVLALCYFGLRRPLQIVVFAGPVEMYLAGAIGFLAMVLSAAFMRRTSLARPVGFVIGGVGLLAALGATAVALVIDTSPSTEAMVAVPDSDAVVVVAREAGGLSSTRLFLEGDLGPFTRRHEIASFGSCTASIEPTGSGAVEVSVTGEVTEGACGIAGPGTFLVRVEDDGWTTSIEAITRD